MREVKEPQVRRAEIIQSAKRLFQCKGYLNVTTQDIVNDLKISRGLLYYHFKSKEDILKHIVEMEVDGVRHRLKAVVVDERISSIDKIEQFILATIIPSSAETAENRAVQESLKLPENTYITDQIYRSMAETMASYFEEILVQGNEEGAFNVSHPRQIAVFLINAFLFTLNSKDFKDNDKSVAEQYLEVFIEIVNKVVGIDISIKKYING